VPAWQCLSRGKPCLMVGLEAVRLPDLVNRGRVEQTVSYR
jgi:hypothetical protein